MEFAGFMHAKPGSISKVRGFKRVGKSRLLMQAYVLRNIPAAGRVQMLLDMLGRPMQAKTERKSEVQVKNLANLAPILAATHPNGVRNSVEIAKKIGRRPGWPVD